MSSYASSPTLTWLAQEYLTCCASITPYGLILAPGQPWGDEPGPGNLGFTATRILIWFIATRVCILTNLRSTVLYSKASLHRLRSPTTHLFRKRNESIASVYSLIANHFRRDIAR